MNRKQKAEVYLLLIVFLLINGTKAALSQMSTYPAYPQPNQYENNPVIPSVRGSNLQGVDHGLSSDSAKASDERSEYSRFKNQASEYQIEINKRLQLIENDEELEKRKEGELEQQIKRAPMIERGKILSQIEACRRLMEKDESEKKQANLYLYRTGQWLQYEKGQVENAEYNVAEDQEAMAEDAAKARQAERQRAWEAQKLSNAQYWQNLNNPPDYGYGTGYGSGYGRSYRSGHFHGYSYRAAASFHAAHSSSSGHGHH